MSLILFSRQGIHFESKDKGDVNALFIPAREQMRTYTDIPQPSTSTVRDRYGQSAGTPLWRKGRDSVEVYGTIPSALSDRRQGVHVHLPQDFVPPEYDVFYFTFGDRWVIHGVKTRTDDGLEQWGVSKIDAENKDGVIDTVVTSVSDRMLEALPEKTLIAVHDDDALQNNLAHALKPLGLKAIAFSTLAQPKSLKPLYTHRDYSLLMLTFALFALLIVIGSVVFLMLNKLKLDNMHREIAQLEEQIRQQQANRPLGHIRNPNSILKAMAQRQDQKPSGVIHAAGKAASSFGELARIRYQPVVEKKGKVPIIVELSEMENDLLLYQEEVAKSVLRDHPWVREIERIPGAGAGILKMQVQVE